MLISQLGTWAMQLGPWIILAILVVCLVAMLCLVHMVLRKRHDLPDKDVTVQISPTKIKIAFTEPTDQTPDRAVDEEPDQ